MSAGEVMPGQIEYYRARAPEYDQYYDRTGPFDLGPEGNAAWLDELASVTRWLQHEAAGGVVLELAAGTGWWTHLLAPAADRLVALDAAPEMLEVSRARNADADVEFVESDVFAYRPEARFDLIFFGFWLSHVPSEMFERFWTLLDGWLAPGGRVLLVDNIESSAPWIQARPDGAPEGELMIRRLNDGRTFTIVKTELSPTSLRQRLDAVGWEADLQATSTYFLYGAARPTM